MNCSPLEVIAIHGWGMPADLWLPWEGGLPRGSTLRTFDRGYFGESRTVEWEERNPEGEFPPRLRLLLLHSMAPLYTPGRLIAAADRVILFGAFRTFHPDGLEEGARSREVLSRMREALRMDPWQVLTSFERRCGLESGGGAMGRGGKGTPGWEDAPDGKAGTMAESDPPLNLSLLSSDLDRLDSEEIDLRPFREVPQVIVAHGTADRIVAHSKGEALPEAIGDNAALLTVEGAGHALPFSHRNELLRRAGPHLRVYR